MIVEIDDPDLFGGTSVPLAEGVSIKYLLNSEVGISRIGMILNLFQYTLVAYLRLLILLFSSVIHILV